MPCERLTRQFTLAEDNVCIEDVRIATAELRHRGYVCDRITHVELMSFIGSQYLGNLLAGDYHLLWVATPSDWTIHTPGKRAGPHYQRIQNLMVKARALRMQITLMGPPGYFWKLAPIKDTIEDLRLRTIYMYLCHFGI